MSNDNLKAQQAAMDADFIRQYQREVLSLKAALQLSQEQNKVAVEALDGIGSDQVESIFLMRVIAEEALAKIKAMGEA